MVNRESRRYTEKVADPDTGSVIHQCEKPLSEKNNKRGGP